MITKRVCKNGNGEIQLVIRVTGIQDVYRFASHMLTGQSEFAAAGHLALRSLRRQIRPHQWAWMLESLGGPATRRFRNVPPAGHAPAAPRPEQGLHPAGGTATP